MIKEENFLNICLWCGGAVIWSGTRRSRCCSASNILCTPNCHERRGHGKTRHLASYRPSVCLLWRVGLLPSAAETSQQHAPHNDIMLTQQDAAWSTWGQAEAQHVTMRPDLRNTFWWTPQSVTDTFNSHLVFIVISKSTAQTNKAHKYNIKKNLRPYWRVKNDVIISDHHQISSCRLCGFSFKAEYTAAGSTMWWDIICGPPNTTNNLIIRDTLQ